VDAQQGSPDRVGSRATATAPLSAHAGGGERVAIVADSHIGGPGGEVGPLVAQLREVAARGCDRVVLLGDLFQAWVGFRQFDPPGLPDLLAAVRELRAAGAAVDYIEGNRDFFIARSPHASAFSRVGLEAAFTAGGRRWLAVHGDGLDENDRQYRAWRWLSKSLPVRLAMRFLPARLARALVDSTERKLADTNFKHKVKIPEAAIRAYAARRLAEGHDVLVLGHFHEEHRWTQPEGEVWLLPAWFKSRRVEWVA
jgi:UDP-2,3-diacylglucosamine hydrolase